MEKLLNLLEENARLTDRELAVMLGTDEKEITAKRKEYEDGGVIKGYRAVIDKEKADSQAVSALIEIKVQPKFGHGFDDIALRIAALDEVETVYLMSGGFDLCVTVTDKSFQEVAMFVAKRLSPLEGVVSTATHFMLKTYKEKGVLFADSRADDRGTVSF
ncbi:MAG: Lrp/AsnC family transcriptional regulator [Clostridiales bacterium]|nr:Lrp/AsnC family transcriptional regulator [Clostridiales bacterium]